jgi:hypothetical protein
LYSIKKGREKNDIFLNNEYESLFNLILVFFFCSMRCCAFVCLILLSQTNTLEVENLKGNHLNEDNLNENHLNEDNLNENHLNEDNLNEDNLNEDNLNEDNLNENHLQMDFCVRYELENECSDVVGDLVFAWWDVYGINQVKR